MGATLTTKRHGASSSSSSVVVVVTTKSPDHEDTDITEVEAATRPSVNGSLLQLFDPLWPTAIPEEPVVKPKGAVSPAAQGDVDDGRVVVTLNLVSIAHDQRSHVSLKADKATQTPASSSSATAAVSSDQFSALGTTTTVLSSASVHPQPTTSSWPANAWTPQYCQALNWTATPQPGDYATPQQILPPAVETASSLYYPATSLDNWTATPQSGENATSHQQMAVNASSGGSWWWLPHGPAPWWLSQGSSGNLQHHTPR